MFLVYYIAYDQSLGAGEGDLTLLSVLGYAENISA